MIAKKQDLIQKRICIYCLGGNGVELGYHLLEMGYSLAFFGDIDKEKHGYAMFGVSCICYEEVCRLDKKEYVIIVAKDNPEKLVETFRQMGFVEVYSDEEIYKRLSIKDSQNHYKLDDIGAVNYILDNLKEVCYQDKELTHENYSGIKDFLQKDIEQLLTDCVLRK